VESEYLEKPEHHITGMPVPSDEELMLSVAGGDLAAFAQLATRHQYSAWNAAYRFLGDRADAEDVAQEAFLRILDSAKHYRPTASFRTYLYRIVTRLCFDFSRRNRHRRHGQLLDIADKAQAPEGALIASERAMLVRQAVDALPPAQKMAVILRYYEDLSYQEIAVILNTTVKGVERLLARARAALEGNLGGFLEE
jgi:RNA polymerase sigma-70 factor, ECF subfamily